jgi:hypothetical protein
MRGEKLREEPFDKLSENLAQSAKNFEELETCRSLM